MNTPLVRFTAAHKWVRRRKSRQDAARTTTSGVRPFSDSRNRTVFPIASSDRGWTQCAGMPGSRGIPWSFEPTGNARLVNPDRSRWSEALDAVPPHPT